MQITDTTFKTGCALFAVDPATLTDATSPRNMSHGETHGAVYHGTASGQLFVLKFSPVKAAHIPAKRELAAFLANLSQHGVRVPTPLPSAQGNLVEIVADGDQTFTVTQTEQVPGEHLDPFGAACDDAFFSAWGRSIGQMHAVAQHYPVSAAYPTWQDEGASFAHMCQDEAVLAQWNAVNAAFSTLPQPPDAYGIIHNDPHLENLLIQAGQVTLIDFSASHCHWFMIDVSLPVFCALTGGFRSPDKTHLTPDEFARHFFAQFWSGYTQEHQLAGTWLHHMPMFLKQRRILPFILYSEHLKVTQPDFWQQWRDSIIADRPMMDDAYWLRF